MFEERLQQAAARVDGRLREILDRHAAPATPDRLVAAMQHATLGGGKRFRPFLVLECAALLNGAPTAALDVAAALECIHCYSLVHDDLPAMDNDETRRGLPTVWKAFDDWTAILAGDALLTLAFEVVAGAPLPAQHRVELVRLLAADSGRTGMVGGQIIDLEADKLGQPKNATLEHIERLQAMKTGALIRFACEAGAIVGDASPAERAALAAYGRQLGLAFQISDDLLDETGDATKLGKAVGKDAAAGKATLVSLMGLEAARQRLDRSVAEAIGSLAPFGSRADTLIAAARFMANRDH